MAFTRDYRDAHQTTKALPGSPLEAEMVSSSSEPWGETGLTTALDVASLKLMIASWDHLGSLATLLDPDGMTLFGHTIVARAAVDAAARAHRILKPGIPPRIRVARAVTEQLNSAREAAKAEKLLAHDLGRQEVIDDLVMEADGYGLRRLPTKKGERLDEYEEHRLTATEAAEDVLSGTFSTGAGLYAYMSAFVHVADYATLQHLEAVGPASNKNYASVEPRLRQENIGWFATVALAAHAAAYDRFVRLNGWPLDTWEDWRAIAIETALGRR
jgi:hypothetical protein